MDAFIEGLVAHYGERVDVRPSADGGRLIRVRAVEFGQPVRKTDVLIQLKPDFRTSGNRPLVYVAPGLLLPNGKVGRNVNPVTVEGESWLTFSFNFAWRAVDEPWKLVAGALRRFLQND